ncbi:MAG: amidohydrolase [Methylobacteriaceae bacterium]|nr:amidohydrolase [Methylobacteriaceae bacterium]
MTRPLDDVRGFHDEMTAWRRDFHAHPEIGFEEERTSAAVAAKLTEFGCEVHRNVGKTGVVGVLRAGNAPHSIGLRADMDALPIVEANELPYRSQHQGRMHACGHDGHTTMLLGAAKYLAATRNFDGTVNFIFQPAEEGLGGARAMLDDDLFGRFPCDFVYGMHNMPGHPVGTFAIRPGAMMAAGAFFDITIDGKGSHGARPEDGVDPVIIAAQMTMALQTIVSRNVEPIEPAVVSVTQVHAGAAYNVVPDTAILRGTARTFSRNVMALIESNMRRMVENIAASFGARARLDFRDLFAPLVNEPNETALFADVVAELVGEDNVNRQRSRVLGSEDFSFMLEARPGAYINIGNGTEGSNAAPLHNPRYDFNDAALPFGAAAFAALVERKLARMGENG